MASYSRFRQILLHFIVFTNASFIINAYYLSYNGLLWSDSETFCIDHCNSHLASIHNDKQYTEIKTLINTDSLLSITSATGDGYWIGLRDPLSGTYAWTDESEFDFGSNMSGGVYPWLPNQPTLTLPYTQLQSNTVTPSVDLKWRTHSSTKNALPICNDCNWMQLSKYILLRWYEKSWAGAETACNNDFGTNLASIHTAADNEEAKLLCPLARPDDGAYNCWIGLNDRNSEGNFEWTDGTNLDLGKIEETDPWEDAQPDNWDNSDCVVLNQGVAYEFLWDDQVCSDVNKVLCNRPSEICYESNWQQLTAAPSFTWTSGAGCQLTIDVTDALNRGYQEVALDISDKNWYVITIGYTFRLLHWYIDGRFGIHLTIGDYDSSSTTTIWLGWEFVTNGNGGNNQRTFVEINDSDPPHSLNYNMDSILEGTGYVFLELIVRLDELGRLTAKLYQGNQEYDIGINLNDLSSYLPTEYYIQDVGIKNYDMGTECKAFFINGGVSPYAPTSAPSPAPSDPSMPPTLTPSALPSKSPSEIPTDQPSSTPTLSPNYDPTTAPTVAEPSSTPTYIPSNNPTIEPTDYPINPSISISANVTQSSQIPTSRPTLILESPTDDVIVSETTTTLVSPLEQSTKPMESEHGLFSNTLVIGVSIGSAFVAGIILMLAFCCWYVKGVKREKEYNERALSVESTQNTKDNTIKPNQDSPSNPTTITVNVASDGGVNVQKNVPRNHVNVKLNEGVILTNRLSLGHDLSDSSSSAEVNQMFNRHTKSSPGDIIPTTFSPISTKVHVHTQGNHLGLRNIDSEAMYKHSVTKGQDLNTINTPTMGTPLQSMGTSTNVYIHTPKIASTNHGASMGITRHVELEMGYIQSDDGSYAKCIADYVAIDEDQLNMKKHQVVFIKRELLSGWWYAVDHRNNDGWIPSTFVVKLNKEQETMYQERKSGSTYSYGDNYATNLDKYLYNTVTSKVSPVVKYIINEESDDSGSDIVYLTHANSRNVTTTAQDSRGDV